MCLCDVLSRQLTSSVFCRRTFIALFHRRCQPLLRSALLCSVLAKLCAWAEIEAETWENAQEEEKVCVGMRIDGSSHSSVCPVFDRVWGGCEMRATKDGWCLNLQLRRAPPSACSGRGSCLEGRLDYFLHPECFIDTSRGIFFPSPPASSSSGRMWDSWRTTNERLPYHHSRISRLCELYCDRYSHTCRSHACARTCVQINSLRRLLLL